MLVQVGLHLFLIVVAILYAAAFFTGRSHLAGPPRTSVVASEGATS